MLRFAGSGFEAGADDQSGQAFLRNEPNPGGMGRLRVIERQDKRAGLLPIVERSRATFETAWRPSSK